MNRAPKVFALSVLAVALAACSGKAPELQQLGANPELPKPHRGVMPDMTIAQPTAWGDTVPTVPAGFKVAAEGQNGFVCLVLRGWGAPTYSPAPFRDYVYVADLRAPICFDSVSARTMMPYYELRHKLGMDGKGPDEIARGIEAAYARGELPKVDVGSMAYMFSADMYLGPHLGHGLIYPHLMLFLPYYDDAKLGGNERRSGLPFLSDDAGTPFAVTIVPMDKAFAVRAKR